VWWPSWRARLDNGGRLASPVAETKTRSNASNAKQAEPAAEPKAPGRRRITKRKAVEAHIRNHFKAIANHDLQAVGAGWREDGVEELVPTGVLRGREVIIRNLADMLAAVPDLETTVTRLIASDKQAAVEWRMLGTFNGAPYQGIEPTGKPVEIRGFELFELEDGLIASTTVYYDGMTFGRQIGMLPPLDSGAERAMKSAFNAVTKVRRAIDERRGG
jgi:steroid delta-isomerase-like uncharacterized protein